MGLFDGFTRIFETVAAPVFATVTGGPTAGLQTYAAQSRQRSAERNLENSRGSGMFNDYVESQQGTLQNRVQTNNSGGFFGNLGQSIGNFGRDVGGFVQDIAPALSLFGVNPQGQRTNAGTAISVDVGRPEETSSSGDLLGANLGLGGALLQAGRNFARSPGGSTVLGFGAGALGSAVMDGGNGMPRITRRMKSDVRKIYMMAGMNPNATAQILNNLGTYPRFNFDASLVFFILTKRFRNDGPVVTKAAVRKTKSTLRRMKGVVDMYNSVCKPTPARRRAAPSRAKAVQLISNK